MWYKYVRVHSGAVTTKLLALKKTGVLHATQAELFIVFSNKEQTSYFQVNHVHIKM